MLHCESMPLLTSRTAGPLLASRRPHRFGLQPGECPLVAAAIVDCMARARRPSEREVAEVAARIYRDVYGSAAAAWLQVRPGSPRHRSMIAAARFALGDGPRAPQESPLEPGEPWIWWNGSERSRQCF